MEDSVVLAVQETTAQLNELQNDLDSLLRGIVRGSSSSDTLMKAAKHFAALDNKFLRAFENINDTQEHLHSLQNSLDTITTDLEQTVKIE